MQTGAMPVGPATDLENPMKFKLTPALLACSLMAGLSLAAVAPVHAQGATQTRAQVKMDRDMFLAMARWDEDAGNWVLKDDMVAAAGAPTREEVKAMRDKFLSMNRWDDSRSQWVPVNGGPREMSKLTREQVKKETVMFLKTHRFDDYGFKWIPK
jgi:hypothetical protein